MPGTKCELLFKSIHGATLYPAHTITAGKEVQVANRALELTPANLSMRLLDLPGKTSSSMPLNRDGLELFFNSLIAISRAPTTYDEIVKSRIWCQFYQRGNRSLAYVNGTTLTPGVAEDSIPCKKCGLVLPMKLITIDHQRPQAGGEFEAVAKVFRIFGLTLEGPKGAKGKAFQELVQKGGTATNVVLAGDMGVLTVAPLPVGVKALGGNSLADRYTLNDSGTMYYSLVKAAGALKELQDRCMHSLLNLAPLCQSCNNIKNNQLKF